MRTPAVAELDLDTLRRAKAAFDTATSLQGFAPDDHAIPEDDDFVPLLLEQCPAILAALERIPELERERDTWQKAATDWEAEVRRLAAGLHRVEAVHTGTVAQIRTTESTWRADALPQTNAILLQLDIDEAAAIPPEAIERARELAAKHGWKSQ